MLPPPKYSWSWRCARVIALSVDNLSHSQLYFALSWSLFLTSQELTDAVQPCAQTACWLCIHIVILLVGRVYWMLFNNSQPGLNHVLIHLLFLSDIRGMLHWLNTIPVLTALHQVFGARKCFLRGWSGSKQATSLRMTLMRLSCRFSRILVRGLGCTKYHLLLKWDRSYKGEWPWLDPWQLHIIPFDTSKYFL